MVAKVIHGMSLTIRQYEIHCRRVWQICFIFGIATALIGRGTASGMFLVMLSILGLIAYFLDMGQQAKKKAKK